MGVLMENWWLAGCSYHVRLIFNFKFRRMSLRNFRSGKNASGMIENNFRFAPVIRCAGKRGRLQKFKRRWLNFGLVQPEFPIKTSAIDAGNRARHTRTFRIPIAPELGSAAPNSSRGPLSIFKTAKITSIPHLYDSRNTRRTYLQVHKFDSTYLQRAPRHTIYNKFQYTTTCKKRRLISIMYDHRMVCLLLISDLPHRTQTLRHSGWPASISG